MRKAKLKAKLKFAQLLFCLAKVCFRVSRRFDDYGIQLLAEEVDDCYSR